MVDHLFRATRRERWLPYYHIFLGLSNLQMAEDVVQDSFVKALQVWKLNGPPENPEAWMLTVAKNKALDLLRRQELHNRFSREQIRDLAEHAESFFHEQEIADSQLRMIFACCHPALKQEDQVALTLKIGFRIFYAGNCPRPPNQRSSNSKKNYPRKSFFARQ